MVMMDRASRSPKLSHIAFDSADFEAARDWWKTLLDAQVFYEDDRLVMLSTSKRGCEVTIVNRPPGREEGGPRPRTDHVAFEYPTVTELGEAWRRLETAGVSPDVCIRHSATVSLYYEDPEDHRVELFAWAFSTPDEIADAMSVPRDGFGEVFDPAEEFDPNPAEGT